MMSFLKINAYYLKNTKLTGLNCIVARKFAAVYNVSHFSANL